MCSTRYKLLTTSEVADAIGVSESSVKRWIDSGDLRATKTNGGHRRVELTEFSAFVAQRGLPIVDPRILGVPDSLDVSNFEHIFKMFTAALRLGNGVELKAILQALRLAGHSPAQVCDELIYPSFRVVRSECLHPSEECVVLHRGIAAIVSVLKSESFQTGKKLMTGGRGGIVCADVGYDVDGLPVFLAEAAIGPIAQAVQLGVNVPMEVLKGVLQQQKPAIVWLSGSGPFKDRQLSQKVFSLLDIAEQTSTRVCVHGLLRVLPRHKNAAYVSSFSEFFGFVKALSA